MRARSSRRAARGGLAVIPRLSQSRSLAALAGPIAVTQLAQVALTTTDTVMIGLLGTEALAAGGLALVLFNQVRTMGVGLITAAGNQVAAEVAAEQDGEPSPAAAERVCDVVRASVAVATVAGLVGALALITAGCALGVLGQDPAVVDRVRPLLVALAPGLLPCLWFQAVRHYTVGMRRPQALVWITVGSIAVNAALNALLIYGLGPLPRLGLPGVGVATSLVYLLSFAALCAVVRRDPVLAPMLSLRGWAARRTTLKRLFGLGLPISATYASEAGFFSVLALVVGSFGAAALAAHTAVNQIVYIVFQVTIGLSHGASILVSREIALGRPGAAARTGRLALGHGAVVMAAIGALYLAAPQLVLAPFFNETSGPPALAIAMQLLTVAAVLQFADCAQNIGVGLLRGLDDTRAGFRATLAGYWGVGLPVALVLGRVADLGPPGVWLGLLTGLAATAALLLVRFARGVRVPSAGPAVSAS